MSDKQLIPSSPKLRPLVGDRSASWYRYYAGFSSKFVGDLLNRLSLTKNDLLIDPWNGAGTTTALADCLGQPSWGGDINPAMVVIGKARLLGQQVSPSELSLCDTILADSVPVGVRGELLETWFAEESAAVLRGIERSIARTLDPAADLLDIGKRVSQLSSLAAFFYLVLFKTVRRLVDRFSSSNPTWIRKPTTKRSRLRPSRLTIEGQFRSELSQLVQPERVAHSDLEQNAPGVRLQRPAKTLRTTIEVAASTALPLLSSSATAAISSPPYCTRIDYAVATSPELAVLGLTEEQFKDLRRRMIGSAITAEDVPDVDFTWGRTCIEFIERVALHPSKASGSYYLKSHLQYFNGLAGSLKELDRVLRREGSCVLVVQDSHYKEVHNDLATIVSEMAAVLGWRRLERFDYSVRQHMARVHPGASVYRETTKATESVLLFQTASA